MDRTILRVTSIAVALLTLTSCLKEEFGTNDNHGRDIVFSASFDSENTDTRTQMDEGQEHILWSAGDKITIFDSDEIGYEFTASGAGSSASFALTDDDSPSDTDLWYALYPYDEDADLTDGVFTTTLKDEFTETRTGSFNDNMNIAVAKSSTMSLSFKNVLAWLRLASDGFDDDVVKIEFRGNNDENLTGQIEIDYTGKTPSATLVDSNPGKVMTINVENYVHSVNLPKEERVFFYIPILPQTFSSGFNLRFYKANGRCGSFTYNKSVTFKRGQRNAMFAGITAPDNEIWYTTSDGEAVTYGVDGDTGNQLDGDPIAPKDNGGIGIIRFTAPVTEIDSYGFYNLSNLTSVTLPESVETIKAYAFRGCSSLKDINFGSNVKTIKSYAFWEMYGIEELVLPEGLETVEEYAFQYLNHLKKVTIPESIRTFGSVTNGMHHSPFINSHIIERFVGKFASADGRCLILDEADGNKVLLHFAGTGYSGQSYSIPSGVTSIAYQAFDYTAPKSIILPEGLLSIEPQAFSWCSSYLESVTIPTTLTSIGTQAFRHCTKLKEVKLKPTAIPTVIADDSSIGDMFYKADASLKIYVPGNLLNAYKTTQYWSTYESRYVAAQTDNELWYTVRESASDQDAQNVSVWPDWDDAYGSQIMPYYDEDRGVWIAEFDNPIRSVPNSAFRNNYDLKSISLPSTVEEIGDEAFSFCPYLESVQFGCDTMESIGYDAFSSCALKTISLPNTNSLGRHAFTLNNSLTSVNLEGYVELNVEDGNPFYGCGKLAVFTGANDMISDGGRCLISGNTLVSYAAGSTTGTYTVPENVTKIVDQAFIGSTFTNLVLPENLDRIGWAAISSCPSLKSLDIPASISFIEGRFISNCESLSYIKMNSTVPPPISESAFADISDDLVIYVPRASYDAYCTATYWKDVKDHFAKYPRIQGDNEIWYTTVDGTESLWLDGLGQTLVATTYDPVNEVWIASFSGDFSDIPDDAFSGETNLKSISFSDYIEVIGERAFLDCDNLESIHFFEGTTNMSEIGADAFANCNLKSLELPDCLDAIGGGAFAYNYNLTTVKLPSNPNLQIDTNPFIDCSSLASFTGDYPGISFGLLLVCNNKYCSLAPAGGTTGINLSNGKTGITSCAFYGCKGLKTIIIPQSVTYVGYGAFSECEAMEDIYLTNHQVLPQTDGSVIFNNIPENCKIHVTRAAWSDLLQNSSGKEGWVDLQSHFVLPDGDDIELNSTSDYTSDVWNSDYSSARINMQVPSVNDVNSRHAQFVSDLNAIFVGINNSSMTYYFQKEAMESITSIGGLRVRFLVDDESLRARYSVSGGSAISVLFGEIQNSAGNALSGYEMQPVALICNGASINESISNLVIDSAWINLDNAFYWCKQDWTELIDFGDAKVADALLNTNAMKAYIGADIYLNGEVLPHKMKFVDGDGNDDYFQVNVVRPVTFATTSTKSFKDTDLGETGSYLSIPDILDPSDWRGRKFSSYPSYWNYYGSFDITFDTENAEIERNGSRQSFPVNMKLIQIRPDNPTTTVNGTKYFTVTHPFRGITVRIPYNDKGCLLFCNNGSTVSSANIYVKASVSYGFGDITTDWIKIPVVSN